MKKIYGAIIVVIFLISTFLAMNLYTSNSLPGYGQEACNNCHNQPIFAKNVNMTFTLGNWSANQLFEENGVYATNEVPTIQTNDANSSNIEFVKTVFLKNSTHFMAMFEVPDSTPQNASSSTSDKFGVLFNINESKFTIGDFFTYYNRSDSSLDTRLSGQMGFKNGGEADLWYVDTATTGFNTTGKASDEYITTTIFKDRSTQQDVYYALWHGVLAVHSNGPEYGYRIWFVRNLTTNDPNDVQFNDLGNGINYAVAWWDNSQNEYHHSSFDQMLIVGDVIGLNTVTTSFTQTDTELSNVTIVSTAPASISTTVTTFSIVIGLAVVAVALPIITYIIRPKK